MSVHTPILPHELENLLSHYAIGKLVHYEGITAGVTNSIYHVVTSQDECILTIFEQLTKGELPFYIQLMNYLAEHHFHCPQVISDEKQNYLQQHQQKAAMLSHYLPGECITVPSPTQIQAVAKQLARLHILTENYPQSASNARGMEWMINTTKKLNAKLSPEDAVLLHQEIHFLIDNAPQNLPKSIIHADLFRDNVLFENDQLTGFIDFYYACFDDAIYDIAITINDWCLENETFSPTLMQQFLEAYQSIRRLLAQECNVLPYMLRKAALRFWLSRLHDRCFIPAGEKIQHKDPSHFRRLLHRHRF